MELDLFLDGLKTSLVNRGIPPEMAARHVASLGRTFTKDDLNEIESIRSTAEIEQIADSIAAIIRKSKTTQTTGQNPPAAHQAESVRKPAVSEETESDQPKPAKKQPASNAPAPQAAQHSSHKEEVPARYAQNSADFFAPPEGQDITTKGVTVFWLTFILTLPITLALLAGLLAVFGGMYLGLIVMMIGLVLAMIAIVGAGCGIALIGIIYGITQLFTFMAAGLYEIGLGVMIGGGVLAAGILLYNLAIRFLPWVMKWVTVLFSFVFGQCRNLFYLARRECYKL